MALLRPFHSIRPNPDQTDVDGFLSGRQEDCHISLLSHPEGDRSERSKYVRYARATSLLHEWLANETLTKENQPGVLHVQSAEANWLVALVDLENDVHPLSTPAPRETPERTWLLEATNTQVETIDALPVKPVQLPQLSGTPSSIQSSEIGLLQTQWIHDQSQLKTVQDSFRNTPIGIVNRLGTFESVANSFAKKRQRNPKRPVGAVLCAILVEKTGRPLKSNPIIIKTSALGPEKVQGLLLEHFDLHEASNQKLMATMHNNPQRNTGVFGLALPGDYTFTAQAKDIERLALELSLDLDQDGLDHQVLHRFVFERLFGLTNLDVFTYAKSSEEALEQVETGEASAFFVSDPEMSSMEETAIATGVFPPRSVDLTTPAPTGLAMWSLNDLDA